MTFHSERQYRRHAVRTDCRVSAADGRLLAERSVDVSYDGARVLGRLPARLGEPVRVRLRVPGSAVWLEADGHVTRLVEGRRCGDEGPAFGLRLARMDGMSRVLLASILRGFPPPTAARGGRRDYARIVRRIAAGRG